MLLWFVFEVLAGLRLCFVELNTECVVMINLDASCCNIYLRALLLVCIGFVNNETVGEACHIWALAVHCFEFCIIMHKVRTCVLEPDWWCVHLIISVIWSANWKVSLLCSKQITKHQYQHLQWMDDSRKTEEIHQASLHPKQLRGRSKARWKEGNCCLETSSAG